MRSSSEFNFSMITIIFEDNIDFYFARQRVPEKLEPGQHVSAAGRRALPGPRRHGPGPDLLVHGRRPARAIRSIPADLWALNKFYIAPQLNSAPGVAEVAVVGGMPLEYQIDVGPKTLRAYGITLGELYAAVGKSNMPAGGGVIQKNNAEYIVRGVGWIKDTQDIEKTVIKEIKGTPIYVTTVATVHLGTQFRRSVFEKDGNEVVGGVGADAARRESAGRHRADQGQDPGAAAGPARRRAHRARLRPHAADSRRHPHAHRRDAARNDHRLAGDPADPDALPQRVRDLHHAAAGGAVLVPPDVGAAHTGIIDIQANIMSLAGITISIGILVDQAIVMIENATHHLDGPFRRPARSPATSASWSSRPAARSAGRSSSR